MHSCHRGVAKAGKKQKVGGSSKDPIVAEPERQVPEALEATIQNPEDLANDPPPQVDIAAFEEMNIEVNPAAHQDPPSPKSPTPPKPTNKVPPEKDSDNITITGMAYTAPGASTVLTKHSAKEESPALEKGKAKLHLDSYSSFSPCDIYAGYLSRLNTSRDMEAGLVQLMKQKYEV